MSKKFDGQLQSPFIDELHLGACKSVDHMLDSALLNIVNCAIGKMTSR